MFGRFSSKSVLPGRVRIRGVDIGVPEHVLLNPDLSAKKCYLHWLRKKRDVVHARLFVLDLWEGSVEVAFAGAVGPSVRAHTLTIPRVALHWLRSMFV